MPGDSLTWKVNTRVVAAAAGLLPSSLSSSFHLDMPVAAGDTFELPVQTALWRMARLSLLFPLASVDKEGVM